jgi:hypothetical protein
MEALIGWRLRHYQRNTRRRRSVTEYRGLIVAPVPALLYGLDTD